MWLDPSQIFAKDEDSQKTKHYQKILQTTFSNQLLIVGLIFLFWNWHVCVVGQSEQGLHNMIKFIIPSVAVH